MSRGGNRLIHLPGKSGSERKIFMADFSINEMLNMQKQLQDKYKDKWKKFLVKRVKTSCFG